MNIPVEKTSCLVGLNSNVTVGEVVIHVQTEDFAAKCLLVTNVLVDGHCIRRIERNYAEHVMKAGFASKLCKVAKAQQEATVQRVPEIWADHVNQTPERQFNVRIADQQLVLLARVTWLFELGLRLREVNPEIAELTWRELLEIDPTHRKAAANLNRLVWARQQKSSN
jgi:hypothetical protein